MSDWDNIDRHLGPSGDAPAKPTVPSAEPPLEAPQFAVPTPLQVQGAPAAPPIIEPLAQQQVALPAVQAIPDTPPDTANEEWSAIDEFDPRFCTICHKKIPHIVSERQEMCDECLAKHGVGIQPLPTMPDPIGQPGVPVVHCPMCASTDVEREWKNDWISTAVDLVADVTSLGAALLTSTTAYGYGRMSDMSPNTDIGRVKAMRHRCLTCGHKWVD